MCRIAGLFHQDSTIASLKLWIESMAQLQAHGGPDDEGFFLDEEQHLALGHKRLSLLDLSAAGHQPMFSEDERHVIVFNGEVYNFQSLKTELTAMGAHFKSHTDTEVILAAFAAWGIHSFPKLKGMFAFALFDQKKREIYLVRDAQGIKPLYYYHQDGILAFASEVKAFQTLPFTQEPNPHWSIAFLSFGHLPEPMTTLKQVFMLPKGHYLKFDLKNPANLDSPKAVLFEKREIWDFEGLDLQKAIDEKLDHAIQKQLVADAPIGVFLSGGIDSSLLALRAAKYQKERLITVSLAFPEAQFSEQRYQDIVSKKLPGEHVHQEVSQKDFEQYFEQILTHMDQPSVDGINSWFVAKAAHDAGLRAVLSGVGADELFGGYPSFKRISQIPKIRKFQALFGIAAHVFKKDALQRVEYLQHSQHSAFEYLFLRGFYSPQQLKNIFGIDGTQQKAAIHQIAEPLAPIPANYQGERAAWYEQHYFMQNQLLKDSDSMSMQHGLEIRVPFLDPDLMAFINSIASAWLFDPKKPAKHALIHAFDNLLPEEIWNRPKMGFTFPFQYWLKEHPLYQNLKQKHQQNRPLQNLFKNYEADRVHWSKIMSLLVLERFGGRF
jgi:asparagine synthase (glutamine-hydrolysing)